MTYKTIKGLSTDWNISYTCLLTLFSRFRLNRSDLKKDGATYSLNETQTAEFEAYVRAHSRYFDKSTKSKTGNLKEQAKKWVYDDDPFLYEDTIPACLKVDDDID